MANSDLETEAIKIVFAMACHGVASDFRKHGQSASRSHWVDLANAMMDAWPEILGPKAEECQPVESTE